VACDAKHPDNGCVHAPHDRLLAETASELVAEGQRPQQYELKFPVLLPRLAGALSDCRRMRCNPLPPSVGPFLLVEAVPSGWRHASYCVIVRQPTFAASLGGR
jgi:hypothetical protein